MHDVLITQLLSAINKARDAPFSIPADWSRDEIEACWNDWINRRMRMVDQISRLLLDWQIEETNALTPKKP